MASRSGTAVLALLLLAAATLSADAYPAADPFCPWDSGVKFSACAAALGLVGAQAGSQLIGTKCCELVSGLAAAEAAACLCVSAKESALGVVSAEWSVGVELLASACSKELPDGFKCV